MMEIFNRFKKKMLIELLIKCLILSFSLFFLVFGVLFILTKREVIDLAIWLDLIIGFSCGVVLFGLLYLIFKPSDKMVAYRLDKEFELDEKVQTMFEYKDKDGLIINIQREDTINRLNDITPKRLKFRIHYILYILLAIGCATLITSVSIPKINHPIVEPDKPEDSYTLTEWQMLQVKKLIEYVDQSKLEDEMKTSYKGELNSLLKGLEEAKIESQMKNNVLTAIANINLVMLSKSTNKDAYETLKNIGNNNLIISTDKVELDLKSDEKYEFVVDSSTATEIKLVYMSNGDTSTSLPSPVLENVGVDEKYLVNHEMSIVKDGKYKLELNTGTFLVEKSGKSNYALLADACKMYSSKDVSDVIYAIQSRYMEAYDKKQQSLVYMLKDDVEQLKEALTTTTLKEDDPLYTALNSYINKLESSVNVGYKQQKNAIKEALDELEPVYVNEISKKCENRDVAWYVEDNLREIFGLPPATNREDSDLNSGDSDSNNNQDGGQDFTGGGGLGDGDFIFSSKDLIYDYNKNELVIYGELYDSYYAIINGLINEGELSDDMINYIKTYYNSLLKPTNNE